MPTHALARLLLGVASPGDVGGITFNSGIYTPLSIPSGTNVSSVMYSPLLVVNSLNVYLAHAPYEP